MLEHKNLAFKKHTSLGMDFEYFILLLYFTWGPYYTAKNPYNTWDDLFNKYYQFCNFPKKPLFAWAEVLCQQLLAALGVITIKITTYIIIKILKHRSD